MNLEARIKVTDTIGVVPFFDAGNAFESSTPHLEQAAQPAGIGLRYYTPIGPDPRRFRLPAGPAQG